MNSLIRKNQTKKEKKDKREEAQCCAKNSNGCHD